MRVSRQAAPPLELACHHGEFLCSSVLDLGYLFCVGLVCQYGGSSRLFFLHQFCSFFFFLLLVCAVVCILFH